MADYEMQVLPLSESKMSYNKTFTNYKIFELGMEIKNQQLIITERVSFCESWINENETRLKLDSIIGFDYTKSKYLTKYLIVTFLALSTLASFLTIIFDENNTLDFTTIILTFVACCFSFCVSVILLNIFFKRKLHIITMNKIYTFNANTIPHNEIIDLWNIINNNVSSDK